MIIIYVIIIFLLLNNFLLCVYCSWQKKRDKTNYSKIIINNSNELKEIKNSKSFKGFIKKIYHSTETYIYGWMRYNCFLVGKIPSQLLRNFIYKCVYRMDISRKTVIQGGCEFRSPWNIKIGKSIIGNYCILDGRHGIEIENNVVLGSGVHIWTEEHSVNDILFRAMDDNCLPVLIREYCWICSDSTILPGVTADKGSVLATRGCTTKNMESYGIYGGIPARKISERNRDLKYSIDKSNSWKFF